MKRVSKVLAMAVVLAAGCSAQGAEELPWNDLKAACEKFLSAYASPKDMQKMDKYLKSRVEDRIKDAGVDEDTAMRSIMLDWAAGNAARLEKKERESLKQACFYFARFIEKGCLIPGQMRERLTPEKARELIQYLEEEAGKVTQMAAK